MPVTERNHDDDAHKTRFAELIQKVCEGELSSADAEALRELLQEDEERRRAYLRTVHMMAGLRKWACSRGNGDIADLLSLAEGTNYVKPWWRPGLATAASVATPFSAVCRFWARR